MTQLYYKVYYSKDVRKKKKVYSDGIFFQGDNKIRLYDEQCHQIYQGPIKNMYYHNVDSEEEFLIGNSYYVSVDKPISKQSFISGSAFLANAPPVVAKKAKLTNKPSLPAIQQGSIQLQGSYIIDKSLVDILRPHQLQGVKFMFECITGNKQKNIDGCILADYMGLGKTLQILALLYVCLKDLSKQNQFKKAIVVSPLSMVKPWEKEQEKWLKDKLQPVVASGGTENIKTRCQSFAKDKYRLLFISYESFIQHISVLNNHCDILVFDEGHRLKNNKTKTYNKIKSFSCKKRILLTGTPLQNNIEQFYACICLVNPYLFPSEDLFKNLFKKPIQQALKSTATDQEIKFAMERSRMLVDIVKKFSLRRRGDVLKGILPPKKEYHVFLPLTELQSKWFKKLITQQKGKQVMELMTMLRKLIVSPKLFKENLIRKGESLHDYLQSSLGGVSFKLEFILAVARNCLNLGQKLIVVSIFTENLDLVQSALADQDIVFFRLDGSMTDVRRQTQIDKFRSSSSGSVFLLSSKAGGTGLNLSVANKMIMMEPDWNPSNDHQVMGRLWRDGQLKPVHIYRLIGLGTFQQKILQRQYLKQNLSDKILDDISRIKLFNMAQMKNLLMLNEQKCQTYKPEDNQIREIRDWNGDFRHCPANTFAYLKKEQNNLSGVNQFQDEDCFVEVQKEQLEQGEGRQESDYNNQKYERQFEGDSAQEEDAKQQEQQARQTIQIQNLQLITGSVSSYQTNPQPEQVLVKLQQRKVRSIQQDDKPSTVLPCNGKIEVSVGSYHPRQQALLKKLRNPKGLIADRPQTTKSKSIQQPCVKDTSNQNDTDVNNP